ncbi:hypothetical protein GQ37_023310 [Janthinobacterium sp. BJB1]|uniref:hypothetical protein n=1 Tax=Janthinobacterium sp. GW458P TaxID=1981504 RepID=UPI000A3209D6|nr:hypothetical protein [Janthinobacterium sp. GW458P]MBE3027029.1 hypothetical protein [Janthinobacterium sp. GW458P]PHV15886.1 hypothetical protein CSQ90_15340 [Janthinobacterium sp. BJB303]PJC96335.1 hypothetical protein GQ37_023310 [Janthinobacterium sp. BJB1]
MSALPARHRRALCLCLAVLLCACASPRTDLAQVRALAAGGTALNAFSELSQRHVDSYQRTRPYLSPAEDARERALDAQRRAAQADVARVAQAVRLYLQALGRLAQAEAYDVQPELAGAGAAIRAWPGSGIDDRHVSAYTVLLQQLARLAGAASQQAQLAQVLHDGDAPLQTLLAALDSLLALYDKSGDNERDVVLGLLEVEIAYADTPQQRLLAVLAKSMQQSKSEEYRLAGLRHTLTRQHLADLAREHARLAAAATEARWTDHQAANAAKRP